MNIVSKKFVTTNRKLIINIATTVVWIGFLSVSGAIYYVNHYLPKGREFPTGEVVCMNDDRGPCAPEYIEDVTELSIPDWAKFFKKSEGQLLWMGLLFTGIVLPTLMKNPES